MKNKLLYLLLLSAWITGYAQVQIGSDTKNASFLFPFRVGANYSYAQTLYLASEINASGAITSIKWYYSGHDALANSQNLDIYLKTTTKSSFAMDTDWVPVTAADKYYSAKGIITGSAPGWVTLTLDKAFQYNGTDNLVVGVDENMDNSDTNNTAFYTTEVSGKRSIIAYSVMTGASANPDPLNPPVTGFTTNSANFVSNIIFGGITQSCTTPANITFSNMLATSATVSWTDSATHTEGSQYYLSTTKTPPTASTPATGIANTIKTIDIPGLSGASTYYVWVRNNCGNGSYSAWSEMSSFLSGCGTYATFFENFDTAANGGLPLCWSSIVRGDGDVSGASASVTQSATFAYSGTNFLKLSNASSTGTYDIIAVSPELSSLPSGTNRLKFYAKYAGTGITSGAVQIGTLNNNTNDAVFTPLVGQTISLSGAYTLYTVDLTGYTGSDRYIGLRFASTTAKTFIYIDNVLYEVKPSCPDVSNIAITAVTDKKVTVSWVSGGVENNWDVAIGDATVTDPTTLAFVSTSNTAHTFTNTTDLNPGTNYKVWVRSNCAADKKGYYFGGLAFTTFCTSATVINENFDSTTIGALPNCWSKILRGTTLSANAYIQTIGNTGSDANFATSGANSAKIFSDAATGDTNEIILVSPPLSNLGANTNRLRFKVSGKVTPQLQIGTLNTNIATAVFTPLASQPLISVAGSPSKEYAVDFSSYAGGTNMFIGFKLISPSGAKTIYIDDIIWETKPACADVKNIVVSGVTTTSSGFTWDVQGTEHLWDVAVGPDSAQDPTGLSIVTSDPDVNAAEVDNLQPATAYKVWVRSHCDFGVSGNWIGPVQFNTECNAVASFSESFDAYAYNVSQELPPCWKKIIRNASADSSIGISVQNIWTNGVITGQSHSITAYAGASNHLADVILVCPMVSTLKDPTYRLNVNAQGSTIEVGTVNNASATATFTKITEFAPKGLQTVDLSSYTGTDQYIALRLKTVDAGSSQYFDIDDINWTVTANLGTNEFDLSKMNYYPNPVKDFLNIYCDSTITSVSIYNVLGQKVLEDTVNGSNIKVNMSMLNAGAYFVKLDAGSQSKTMKIVKE